MIKKTITLISFILFFLHGISQTKTVSGVVYDYDIGEPLIGVNIIYDEGKGTITDINGKFELKLPQGTYNLKVSYVGFVTQNKEVVVSDKNVFLTFNLKTVTLDEVEVLGDFARTRETPVAFTNISRAQIEEQLASQDIPMILNATPGVYATQSGGGDGDARINIRGFNQRNVAVMLDGIPVNDMENGWVYWSNWFGLDAVLRGTQVQRGLGMSKLAIPSVGGTVNLTTKSIDDKKGISLKQEVGTAGYLRTSLGMTTGRMKNGWGVTFAGSYKQGNGWVDQTWTRGWFYYLRVDKEIGKHVLSVTAMGAPQKHGQRSYQKRISTFDKDYAIKSGMRESFIDSLESDGVPIDMGLRYNYNWGYLSRTLITDNDTIYPSAGKVSTANNFYHKPMFSLRDFWNVSKKLYVSNVLYLSLGEGGGRSFSNSSSLDTETGQVDLQKAYNSNMNLLPPYFNKNHQSTEIMRNAMNNHFWLGLLSTFEYIISDEFTLSGGLDLRTYRGEHFRQIDDLLGGDFYYDDGWNNKNKPNNNQDKEAAKLYVGDKIGYHNDAIVRWGGLFTQLMYRSGNLTAFLNLTGSMSGYKRIDYFLPKTLTIGDSTWGIQYGDSVVYDGRTYYNDSPELENNQTDWKYIPGFTVKGGVNYNLNERMNVFANLGYMSKAQRFSNVYGYSNNTYSDIDNELIRAIELGYSYVHPRFTFNLNTYYTVWNNKPADRNSPVKDKDGDTKYTVRINKMDARHMGVEMEFGFRITDKILFESLLSVGDWIWTSKDTALIYNDNGQLDGVVAFDARGLHVGDAAQIQNRQSVRWQIVKGAYISGSFTYFGKHYSDFNPLDYQYNDPERDYAFDENGNPRQSWIIPSYYMVDFHAGYSWYVNKYSFHLRGSVLNALNDTYITDASNNDNFLQPYTTTFDANSAAVYMGMGRRFNLSLRINF